MIDMKNFLKTLKKINLKESFNMRKELLVLFTLLIMSGVNAMEIKEVFNYQNYGFNVPSEDLAIGQTFKIVDIDPQVDIPANLYDLTNNIWAEKIQPNTATFKVVSTRCAKLERSSPEQQLTDTEIVILQEIIEAIQNNNITKLGNIFRKIPTIEIITIMQSSKACAFIGKALSIANPKTQSAYDGARLFLETKNYIQLLDHTISEEQILQKVLITLIESESEEYFLALRWLIEQENVKDVTGEALERAIQLGFFQKAVFLTKYGAKITKKARELARGRANPPESDKRFVKLLQKFQTH
jgi:hypothetical protein